MTDSMQFDRQKFKAVIRYVCAGRRGRELGKVKLHKILYFADMLRFLETGQPLTGAEYQKQQFGPVAKHLTWALDDLSREGKLRVERSTTFGLPTIQFQQVEAPPEAALSKADEDLLDEVAGFVCSHSARAISEISHNAAWESAALGETLPYFTAYLLVPCEVTDEDVAWAESEARKLLAAA